MVADLGDTHVLSGKDVAEIDLAPMEADPAAVRHGEGGVGKRIGHVLEATVGDRVFIKDENYPQFWANEATGTVATHPSRSGDAIVRMVKTVSGYEPHYWVVLDEARRDADGDGPYSAVELPAAWLYPVSS